MSARTSPVEQDAGGAPPGPVQRRRHRRRPVGNGREPRSGSARLDPRAPRGVADAPRPTLVGGTDPTLEQPAVPAFVVAAGPAEDPRASDAAGVAPAGPPGAPASSGAAVPPGAPASPGEGAEGGRRAVREARRHRHRVAWACVVVVAACLAATVLVLGMARDRRPPRPPGVPPAAVAVPTLAHAPTSSGAPVPEGGDTT